MALKSSLAALISFALLCEYFYYAGFRITDQISPSMPMGWYVVMPQKKIKKEENIVFKAPEARRAEWIAKKWIPKNGWMMKTIFAVPGDEVCNEGDTVLINGKAIAAINPSISKTLFCGKVPEHFYWGMSLLHPHSLDSRYMGLIPENNIIGKAVKL